MQSAALKYEEAEAARSVMRAVTEFGIPVDEWNDAQPAMKRALLIQAKCILQARISELNAEIANARRRYHTGNPLPTHEAMRLASQLDAAKVRVGRLDEELLALKPLCKEAIFAERFVEIARHRLDKETFDCIAEIASK